MAKLNNSTVYHLLGSYGFTGTFNDRLFKYLGSLGFTGTLSDRLYKYLGSLGLTGSMNDRLKKWDGVFPPAWDPSDLFKDGEPGLWAGSFAPTSLRLFQDASGTTPANQAGQPIGKVVRAAGTVDATQATALSRPTLARWPKGGRRNILTYSQDFSNSVWVKDGSVVDPNVATAPDGTFTGCRLTTPGNRLYRYLDRYVAFTAPRTLSFYVKADAGDTLTVTATSITPSGSASFDLTSGTKLSGASDWTIEPAPNGWWRVVFVSTSGTGSAYVEITGATDSILIWGFQFEEGPVTTPYQRVTTAFDVTEAGVPDVWHLWNDGGDSLPVVLTAGSYEIAWVNQLGAVSYASVTSDGTTGTDLLRAERMADVLVREGTFTAAEKTALEAYWSQRYAA